MFCNIKSQSFRVFCQGVIGRFIGSVSVNLFIYFVILFIVVSLNLFKTNFKFIIFSSLHKEADYLIIYLESFMSVTFSLTTFIWSKEVVFFNFNFQVSAKFIELFHQRQQLVAFEIGNYF